MGASLLESNGIISGLTALVMTLMFQAAEAVNPQLFTIATLTGHAVRAMGPNYSVSIAVFFWYWLSFFGVGWGDVGLRVGVVAVDLECSVQLNVLS